MFEHLNFLIPKSEYEIRKGDIPMYFTDTVFAQIHMWQQWKLLGLPWAPLGWAEHPAVFIDVISALEAESNKRK